MPIFDVAQINTGLSCYFSNVVPARPRAALFQRNHNGTDMKSSIVKRSIELHGHKTSVSLEDEFWNGLHAIADEGPTPMAVLLKTIDSARGPANLSSAIRVFVLNHFVARSRQSAAAQERSTGAYPGPAAGFFRA